ncbi:DTW-domain-containing protein [Basidiobolus meristosporus CBS 931.73]|uniref:tRNA-uridine aminocarboxypropyltransferase 1 n=1 Tax=Basidiobolus meristosporus CBS 931.73 TaxID=1314790 RepID=A0A1Y1Z8I9_9FUNG|nr:DTW-domain-containing protein [Basidiobolus meristosporus CBS 931.73]|eukprot:ORY06582.1 DTW-domain-containing protein [Basidiobolus meristosporus CBS 931.73]
MNDDNSFKSDTQTEDYLANLQTNPGPILDKCQKRICCPNCETGRVLKYYCYECYEILGCSRDEIPSLKLPVKLDILKHEKERDSKSTAIHARILAPEDTRIILYPSQIPQYDNPERVLLLYPSEDALTLNEIDSESFDRILVVDGTWNQARAMVRYTPILQELRKVTIKPRKTMFWRFQNISESYLATIEAVYYLYREYHEAYQSDTVYDGRYDDLLFYYKYFYHLIQNFYKENQGSRKFSSRHRKGSDYIKYE